MTKDQCDELAVQNNQTEGAYTNVTDPTSRPSGCYRGTNQTFWFNESPTGVECSEERTCICKETGDIERIQKCKKTCGGTLNEVCDSRGGWHNNDCLFKNKQCEDEKLVKADVVGGDCPPVEEDKCWTLKLDACVTGHDLLRYKNWIWTQRPGDNSILAAKDVITPLLLDERQKDKPSLCGDIYDVTCPSFENSAALWHPYLTTQSKISIDECKKWCTDHPKCVAFEWFKAPTTVQYTEKSNRRISEDRYLGDCVLQSSSDTTECTETFSNQKITDTDGNTIEVPLPASDVYVYNCRGNTPIDTAFKNISVNIFKTPNEVEVTVRSLPSMDNRLIAVGTIDESDESLHTGKVTFPVSVEQVDDATGHISYNVTRRTRSFVYNTESAEISWDDGEKWSGQQSDVSTTTIDVAFAGNVTVDRTNRASHVLEIDVVLPVVLTGKGSIDEDLDLLLLHTGVVTLPVSLDVNGVVHREYKFWYDPKMGELKWDNDNLWHGEHSYGWFESKPMGRLGPSKPANQLDDFFDTIRKSKKKVVISLLEGHDLEYMVDEYVGRNMGADVGYTWILDGGMKDFQQLTPFDSSSKITAEQAALRQKAFEGAFVFRPYYTFNRQLYEELCQNLECPDIMEADGESMHTALMLHDARSLFKRTLARIQINRATVSSQNVMEYMQKDDVRNHHNILGAPISFDEQGDRMNFTAQLLQIHASSNGEDYLQLKRLLHLGSSVSVQNVTNNNTLNEHQYQDSQIMYANSLLKSKINVTKNGVIETEDVSVPFACQGVCGGEWEPRSSAYEYGTCVLEGSRKNWTTKCDCNPGYNGARCGDWECNNCNLTHGECVRPDVCVCHHGYIRDNNNIDCNQVNCSTHNRSQEHSECVVPVLPGVSLLVIIVSCSVAVVVVVVAVVVAVVCWKKKQRAKIDHDRRFNNAPNYVIKKKKFSFSE